MSDRLIWVDPDRDQRIEWYGFMLVSGIWVWLPLTGRLCADLFGSQYAGIPGRYWVVGSCRWVGCGGR